MNQQAKVLIVDDERLNITVLGDLLRNEYNLIIAKNGEQAIKRIFCDEPPDLILLDIIMPDVSGYEICSMIKADPRTENIPVIFITSMTNEDDETKGFQLGAADYVSKPFRGAVVRARIKNHLELKRRGDILERLSRLDGLTGIPNRRRFDTYLSDEWNTMQRVGKSLCVILMDIDFFKFYNDNYGHPAGDECLRLVAEALESTPSRSTDLVARYGGEEFAAILPDTPLDGALMIAEKLRNSVVGLQIPHKYSTTSNLVTISVGVSGITLGANNTGFSESRTEITTANTLVKEADKGLYLAKKQGRNQIGCSISPESEVA